MARVARVMKLSPTVLSRSHSRYTAALLHESFTCDSVRGLPCAKALLKNFPSGETERKRVKMVNGF